MISNTDKYREIIVPIILKYLPQAKIILYGSRARKTDRGGSDVDVAIDIGKVIDRHIMTLIRGDVEESKLPVSCDVVDFYMISQDIKKNIMKDGVIWQ